MANTLAQEAPMEKGEPMAIRLAPIATPIIRVPPGTRGKDRWCFENDRTRYVLIEHPTRRDLWFAAGKAKNLNGEDILFAPRTVTLPFEDWLLVEDTFHGRGVASGSGSGGTLGGHLARWGDIMSGLSSECGKMMDEFFNSHQRRRREPVRAAVMREAWEELGRELLSDPRTHDAASPGDRRRRLLKGMSQGELNVRVRRDHGVYVFGISMSTGDPRLWVYLCGETTLAHRRLYQLHQAWRSGHCRIAFADEEEIVRGTTTDGRLVSPNVEKILRKLGYLTLPQIGNGNGQKSAPLPASAS